MAKRAEDLDSWGRLRAVARELAPPLLNLVVSDLYGEELPEVFEDCTNGSDWICDRLKWRASAIANADFLSVQQADTPSSRARFSAYKEGTLEELAELALAAIDRHREASR
jgi:hypothetical protein